MTAVRPPVLGPGELRTRTTRAGFVAIVAQGAKFVLRVGSMVVLARLLVPEDFGLVGMVTAVTGFLGLFKDGGLSMATVQKEDVTEEQISALFWVNAAIGAALALLGVCCGPAIAAFFHEPRLVWVTIALASGFVFNGLAAQHQALLLREMRFGRLAFIEIAALLVSIAVGVRMAVEDLQYWALVGMAVSAPLVAAAGMWIATGWVPGRPRRVAGIRSMLRYGGVLTLNGLVVYVVYNAEKVLLGRFWGAAVLGIYGRAYQLISIPTENIHTVVGSVMFPALARVQGDPARVRTYFLKAYGLFLALVMPATLACGLFADDLVLVLMGPQWHEAGPVFRLLAPTIVALGLINPVAWLMQATGLVVRSLKISFLIAPVVVLGYSLGLPYGPKGVAIGYSTAMLLLVFPVVLWAKQGTLITAMDMLRSARPALLSALSAAGLAWLARSFTQGIDLPVARLTADLGVLFGGYGVALLYGLKQWTVYKELLHTSGLRKQK